MNNDEKPVKNAGNAFFAFIKKNLMAVIAWILAAVTMILVPPDGEYADYFDMKTLVCLFTIMLCVAAFKDLDIFSLLAVKLIKKLKNTRSLTFALVFITYFASILIANDIALLTFLPLTIAVFRGCGKREYVAATVILQTIGANLGGMIMPFGNPQSLYIFSAYSLTVGEFVSVMAFPFALSLVTIVIGCFLTRKEPAEVLVDEKREIPAWRPIVYSVFFVLSLLSVFDVIDKYIILAAVAVGMLFIDRKAFIGADYGLLLTFVAFFIFANNMARIPAVYGFVSEITEKNALLAAVLGCQIMSNVPTGIFLSKFTSDWQMLLVGTNIGGVGSPVSSLASLITLKTYVREFHGQGGKYMKRCLAYNFTVLLILTVACCFFFR